MVKYLQMDGADDYFSTPTLTFTKVEIDVLLLPITASLGYVIDINPRSNGYVRYSNTGIFNGYGTNTSLNNRTIIAMTPPTQPTTNILNFFQSATGGSFAKGNVYSVKIWNGSSLAAYYDMSTGTVNDQSGNGRNATLNGGTFVDDGTGGNPTGIDGSTSFDLWQSLYNDSSINADTKLSFYQDGEFPADLRQSIFADSSFNADIRNVLYQDISTVFDTLQQIYQSGVGGSISFDLLLRIYKDSSVNMDTRQEITGPKQIISNITIRGSQMLSAPLRGNQLSVIGLKGSQVKTINLKGVVNSMTTVNKPFTMYLGERKNLVIPIDDLKDLTGFTVSFSLYNDDTVASSLFTKSSPTITTNGNTITVPLLKTDTTSLTDGHNYFYKCNIIDAFGEFSTAAVGQVSFKK